MVLYSYRVDKNTEKKSFFFALNDPATSQWPTTATQNGEVRDYLEHIQN